MKGVSGKRSWSHGNCSGWLICQPSLSFFCRRCCCLLASSLLPSSFALSLLMPCLCWLVLLIPLHTRNPPPILLHVDNWFSLCITTGKRYFVYQPHPPIIFLFQKWSCICICTAGRKVPKYVYFSYLWHSYMHLRAGYLMVTVLTETQKGGVSCQTGYTLLIVIQPCTLWRCSDSICSPMPFRIPHKPQC